MILSCGEAYLLSETFGKEEHSQTKMQATGGFRMLLYKNFVIFYGKKLERFISILCGLCN
jgi:hypothetical protein